ncbi:MAG: hypothetical protein SNH18_10370 [Rikenellaceae bacterium]
MKSRLQELKVGDSMKVTVTSNRVVDKEVSTIRLRKEYADRKYDVTHALNYSTIKRVK